MSSSDGRVPTTAPNPLSPKDGSRPTSARPRSLDEETGTEDGTDSIGASMVDRFILLRPLGAGGMGVVYEAQDPELDRRVAIKLLVARSGGSQADRERRLLREARAMARVKHPNVIAVHDVGTYETLEGFMLRSHSATPPTRGVYVVMELLDGVELRKWLVERERSWHQILDVVAAAGEGLQAAHAVGLVHRDFKPSNVIVSPTGAVTVLDFGLARALAHGPSATDDAADLALAPAPALTSAPAPSPTATGHIAGTPRYMAPEQFDAGTVDPRSDQFAFCVSLFEALYGRPPFPDAAGAAIEARRAHRTAATPSDTTVPAWLHALIMRGLSPEPADRHASMTALLTAVKEHRGRRRRVRWIASIGVAVAVATGAGVLFGSTQRAPIDTTIAAPNEPSASLPSAGGPTVLFPFKDETEAIGAGSGARDTLPHLLGNELARVDGLNVIDYFALSRMAEPTHGQRSPIGEWEAAADALSAFARVHGSVIQSGAQLRVVIEIRAPDGSVMARFQRLGAAGSVGDTVRALAPDVAAALSGRRADLTAQAGLPWDYETRLSKGLALLERGNFSEAERTLRAASTVEPSAAEPHFHLALALSWRGRNDDALEEIELALARSPTPRQEAFLAGYALHVAGRHTEAIASFRESALVFPTDRFVLYGRFESLFHGGYPREGIEAYRKLGVVSPFVGLALMHALEHYASQGDREGLQWAIGLTPTVSPGFAALWRTRLHVFDREYQAALEALTRAELDEPTTVDQLLIEVNALAGRTELARTLAEQFDVGSPDEILVSLLALHILRGDDDAHARYRERALRFAQQLATPLDRVHRIAAIATLELPFADLEVLESLRTHLEAAVEAVGQPEPRAEVAIALLAGVPFDAARLERSAQSQFPETAAVANAYLAEQRGAPEEAQLRWQQAYRASMDGRFVPVERWNRARVLQDEAERAIECDEATRPRYFHWSWTSVSKSAPCDASPPDARPARGLVP